MVEAAAESAPRTLRRHDLERAVAAGVIDAARAEALWQFLGRAGPAPTSGHASIWSTCCGTRAR